MSNSINILVLSSTITFGEIFQNQQATSSEFDTEFKFNGKPVDEETGYHYYGARYYSSDLGIWLSVDPLASKYPSLSPYVYCANNPVMLVDPDGRKIRGASIDSDGNVQLSNKASKHTQRAYAEMSKTEVGRLQFKKMVESKTKLKFKITNTILENGSHGYLLPSGKMIKDDNGNDIYKKGTIIISTAKVQDRYDNATEGEIINAVGVHESIHTEPDQIKLDVEEPNSWETERRPIEMEYKSRTEYNNGNNSGFKDFYENPNPDIKDDYNNPKPAYRLID